MRLNVSVSTVSRALHNHPSIGLRTKMQVQKLAEELNYEPNQAAISFKQGKTFTIGVILPNLGEQFFSTAINGVEDVASQNNYTVLIGQSHDDIEREKKIVDTMRRHRVDGLIVSLSKNTTSYEHFEQLEKYSIPVVFFDRVPDTPEAYSVSCNLRNSSVELVDWLVSKGHNHIGFIKGPDTMLPSLERLNGYLEGLKKNKLVSERTTCVLQGYGDGAIDDEALTYYRYAWAVQEMGAYAEEVMAADARGEVTRRAAVDAFIDLFAAGNIVAIARASDSGMREPRTSRRRIEDDRL